MKVNNEKVKKGFKTAGKIGGCVIGTAIVGVIIVLADLYELPERFMNRFRKAAKEKKNDW